MTTKTITPELKLTTLKHLASGKSLEVTATIVGLPRETVLDIASKHGYPDTEKLAWAVDVLATKLDEQAKVLPEGASTPAPRPAPGPSIRPAVALTETSAPITKPDEIRVLLNTAKAHPSKRIQRAADKVFDDLDRLRDLIREDEEKHAERRRLDAEKAAARAEVERLEAQLAAAKAKLRGKPSTATSATPTPTTTEGEHACDHDGCDRTFSRIQALRMHQRRAHEGFDPNAVRVAS